MRYAQSDSVGTTESEGATTDETETTSSMLQRDPPRDSHPRAELTDDITGDDITGVQAPRGVNLRRLPFSGAV